MSDQDSDGTGSGFDAPVHSLITDDANLGDALRRIADAGCRLVSSCVAASITIIERGRAITVGSTSDIAVALDDAQYQAGDGPCLTAARQALLVRIEDASTDGRWPEFAGRALEHGVRCSLSVPLTLSRDDTAGGFNVYGSDGFSVDDERWCKAFATQASIAVSNAQAYWSALQLTHNLSAAMESRAEIEQAKGILMSTYRLSADEAFDLLVARSRTENRKLRDIAGDIVREAVGNDA
jgi:GAF domain-containing protein